MRNDKFRDRLMGGQPDNNIDFADLCRFIESLGFTKRVNGDHHIFGMSGLADVVTIQPVGGRAMAFQVSQVRKLVRRHGL
jgi:hypothetical protein